MMREMHINMVLSQKVYDFCKNCSFMCSGITNHQSQVKNYRFVYATGSWVLHYGLPYNRIYPDSARGISAETLVAASPWTRWAQNSPLTMVAQNLGPRGNFQGAVLSRSAKVSRGVI